MKNIIFTGYAGSPQFTEPEPWLHRIRGYTGILEYLNKTHNVYGIERINYEGWYEQHGVRYFFRRLAGKADRFPFGTHRLMVRLKPDVVFINGFIFPLQILLLRWQLGPHAKIMILHRAEKPFKGVKRYLQKMADRCVSHYLFASAAFGEEWIERGIIRERDKIREIVQASSVFSAACRESARHRLSIDGRPVFLWVGRLDYNKDPFTIIKAFARFLVKYPRAALYMIYQSDELHGALNELIGQQERTQRAVRLVGPVPHEGMADWYNSADFILSGSHYEGSGVAVIEAMSCGCIPVVSNINSFRKMTGPDMCGVLFEPGDVESLLEALERAMKTDITRERSKTISQFQQQLSFQAIADKINLLINE